MTLEIVRSVADLRAWIKRHQAMGHAVGLVPTMGALHDGHLSLVRAICDSGAKAVTTLFVNPKQFGPNEDLDTYPRTEEADAAKLQTAGASLLFAPPVDEMYPDGFSTKLSVPGLGDILEGYHRPGFFDGVATVVAKLLLQAMADRAIFGEKDYQQLQVIKRMVVDINIPVKIISAPTVREDDGLAMSSRNAYLSADDRAIAPVLFQTIKAVAAAIRAGGKPQEECDRGIAQLKAVGFKSVDYLTLRHAESLEPLVKFEEPGRILVAAHLGRTRLIDNIPL